MQTSLFKTASKPLKVCLLKRIKSVFDQGSIFLRVFLGLSVMVLSGQAGVAHASETQDSRVPPVKSQKVIDRIEFVGNRRVRNETLKARIFSREGDLYNVETLRRDFQALWNSQFFEDVKLRTEDSPANPNGKIIIFEVRERPVIRRIRYEGIHSISESDILDRFKERKVGLTVESQFDPTKIK